MAPTMVTNSEWVFAVEDFHRAKFRICAMKMKQFSHEELVRHFSEQVPKLHCIEALDREFKKGKALVLVLEKESAIEACQK